MDRDNLGAELRNFIDRVASNDREGVLATLCIVANADSHVDSFGAGSPDVLAQVLIMAIDALIRKNSDFAEAWLKALRAKRLQGMIDQVLDVVEQVKEQVDEAEGMQAAKPAADALIEKLKGNPGAVPGPDTKQ